MGIASASTFQQTAFAPEAVGTAAAELRGNLGEPASIAFAFVSPDYLPHLEDFVDILRVEGHVSQVVGCTGGGLMATGVEHESGSGFSVLALACAPESVRTIHFTPEDAAAATGPDHWRDKVGGFSADFWVGMFGLGEFPLPAWLAEWNAAFPGVPCAGGIASGGGDNTAPVAFLNTEITRGGVLVGFRAPVAAECFVCQGCRPIGEPLTITRAENNVIYSLGSRPAYEALESAFQGLTDHEKARARGNLFAGIASSEYLEEFRPGDFLVRNIIGADPGSGAVVIGDVARTGQTMQYQYRDGKAASLELCAALDPKNGIRRNPSASLAFICTGRGRKLFGQQHHDARMLAETLGQHPSAGFFCNGEIGPANCVNNLHGYSASIVLFKESK